MRAGRKRKEEKGGTDLVNKKSQGAEVAGGVFFFFCPYISLFRSNAVVSCLPPILDRPHQSRQTWLVIARVNSSLTTAAQVKSAKLVNGWSLFIFFNGGLIEDAMLELVHTQGNDSAA